MFEYIKSSRIRVSSAMLASVAVLFSTTAIADNNSKTRYGITVTNCNFDHDDEDFCADGRMETFANVMKARKANFANDRLLYIYKPEGSNVYQMVSVDKNKKTVTPFYWSFGEATQSVNAKGEKIEFDFDKASNEFCFKGNIYAYRNAYDYDPKYHPEFCFDYDRSKNAFGWFKQ
ncbi:hypothetical protein QL919_08660 [Psychrobacter sp. APC 3426]|uniref:hypothetical protein n=1 Tax=Psychrobacter sp. APC 3426 TaxID=3035177 RepID=UPI0025B399DD|nr:hypothetical protein [Psychrobacter sp. APC 3426]MDN3398794.1 hypothetical protein [Psychrobacter sp. APC 3426]